LKVIEVDKDRKGTGVKNNTFDEKEIHNQRNLIN
jgi:hypothetical protein